MLTRKQHELLMYVNQCLINDGVSPSFDEMKEALGLRSKSGIHRLITALVERGFIHRLPHRARALEVLKLPDAVTAPNSFAPSATTMAPVSAVSQRSMTAVSPSRIPASTIESPATSSA